MVKKEEVKSLGKPYQKIDKVYCMISIALEKEIEFAHRNLKENEKKKTQGKRKRKWTKLEASHELGKWLNSQRQNNRKV